MANLTQRLYDILGPARVSTDEAVLDLYSHDCWPLQAKLDRLGVHDLRPDAVVTPLTVADVQSLLAFATRTGTPVTARGLGSSVTGQPLPQSGGIVCDMSQLTGEAEFNDVDATVTVGAGWNGGKLEQYLNTRGFTLGHSPQSLPRSTVGGWVATNATGQLSSKFGGIEDLAVALEVVLADGTVVWLESNPRSAVGPTLSRLFSGSEGTLGIVTKVRLRVFPLPELELHEAFLMPDVDSGLEAMRLFVQAGVRPNLVRFYDEAESVHQRIEPAVTGCVLLVGCSGPAAIATSESRVVAEVVARHGGRSLGPEPVRAWLDRRYDFSTVEDLLATEGGYAETIEVGHSWSRIKPLYAALSAALAPLADEVLGHFSHVYTHGTSLYVILLGQAADDRRAADRIRQIWRAAMETVLAEGGTLSHHHGAGIARLPYIHAALGPSWDLLRSVKAALDPLGILNPGKLGLDERTMGKAQTC